MVRIATLLAIAGGCGIGVGSMSILVNRQKEARVNQTAFLTKAVNIMRAQPAITNLLGENIIVGKATLQDGWSKVSGDVNDIHIQLRLPVKGEKDNAYLYAFGRKKSNAELYKLYKLEMTFSQFENKKLVFLDLDAVDPELDDLLAGKKTESTEKKEEK